MREIKFRTPNHCHNGHLNFLYFGVDNGVITNLRWGFSACRCSKHAYDKGYEKCGDDQQFTGLKDKNGKEIYEGDIIIFDPLEPLREVMNKGVVEYHVSAFEAMIPEYGRVKFYQGKYTEIIGNIYENPDLLSKSNTEV